MQELVDELGTLPGIGPKSAQRIAFYVLGADQEAIRSLADTLIEVKEKIGFCEICGNIAQNPKCSICLDDTRDQSLLCVVEEVKDIYAIERLREYRGRYHVLGGAIDPIAGVGPNDLSINQLLQRIELGVSEVILALDPNVQGEATVTYLARLLENSPATVSKLASGLPMGGDLDYADEITLGRAFAGRRML